jgi:hypothetical protein
MRVREWLNYLTTEPDNRTPCPVRLIAFLGTLQALALVGYDVLVLKAHFDIQTFGIGLGVLLGGLGTALGLKTDSPIEASKEVPVKKD